MFPPRKLQVNAPRIDNVQSDLGVCVTGLEGKQPACPNLPLIPGLRSPPPEQMWPVSLQKTCNQTGLCLHPLCRPKPANLFLGNRPQKELKGRPLQDGAMARKLGTRCPLCCLPQCVQLGQRIPDPKTYHRYPQENIWILVPERVLGTVTKPDWTPKAPADLA